MSEVKLTSTMKNSYKGGNLDFMISKNNVKKHTELLPQSRRPKNISKAYACKVEKRLKE